MYENERILIISNNVLSRTNNNGKTILSYIDSLCGKNVKQIFFSNEEPSIDKYEYFRISDIDVIRGRFNRKKRGNIIKKVASKNKKIEQRNRYYGDSIRLLREIMWVGAWRSEKLVKWIETFSPTAIFFVGGDACFAYRVANSIAKWENIPIIMYITDDYILPINNEGVIHKLRRKMIRYYFKKSLSLSKCLFTISNVMSNKYEEEFGIKSNVIVNMTEPLRDIKYDNMTSEEIKLVYAGSFYYGRDKVLGYVSAAVKNLNEIGLNVKFELYSNNKPSKEQLEKIIKDKNTYFGGGLSTEQLKVVLNKATIPVFVESFEEKYIEKTRYSLSTKIPEYLSLGKAILAVGPYNIGSIAYLADVAKCVYSLEDIYISLKEIVLSQELRKQLGEKAGQKYDLYHNKEQQQKMFLEKMFN